MSKPRVVFMGTPDFAVPALRALAKREDIDLALVVTQPDRPAGRGKQLQPPPVKQAADKMSLPVLQTASLRLPEAKERIIATRPDLVIVAAFGMILGKWILDLPTRGCVNLHASLLPKYRGASPISAAILAGDEVAGVTLMQMDRGLDTGDMLATSSIPIETNDTTESLTPKLAEVAAKLLDEHLSDILQGTITPTPQPDSASETRQLTKDDGRIDWEVPAIEIERLVRAMWSWPRAWSTLPGGDRIQIHASSVVHEPISPGEVRIDGKRVLVGAGESALHLLRAQLPGGKPLEGHALLQKLQPFDAQVLV